MVAVETEIRNLKSLTTLEISKVVRDYAFGLLDLASAKSARAISSTSWLKVTLGFQPKTFLAF